MHADLPKNQHIGLPAAADNMQITGDYMLALRVYEDQTKRGEGEGDLNLWWGSLTMILICVMNVVMMYRCVVEDCII
jgi:hypothetical protein